ncbi:MAG: OmpA family protein [Deltaproteobacteria bacterium]|nr:OmpA family protein [Deltaproteobacteria bacterium]
MAGYNQLHFPTPVDGQGGFRTPDAKVQPRKTVRVGMLSSYANRAVRLTNPAVPREVQLVDNAFTNEFTASTGVADRFSFGLHVPVQGISGTNNASLASYTAAGAGDLTVQGKWQFLREREGRPAMALIGGIGLPTGARQRFQGNAGVTAEGEIVASKEFARANMAAFVGYRSLQKMAVLDRQVDDMVTYGGRVGVKPFYRWELFGELAGGRMVGTSGSGIHPIELNGGVRKGIGQGWEAQVGGGGSLRDAQTGSGRFRAFAGLAYTFGAPPPPPPPVKVEPIPDQVTITFAINSATVRGNDAEKLRGIARWLTKRREGEAVIAGHADSTGTTQYNLKLSERRASAVARILEGAGAASEQLVLQGLGEAEPTAPNDSEPNRAMNRRVEVRIVEETTSAPRKGKK